MAASGVFLIRVQDAAFRKIRGQVNSHPVGIKVVPHQGVHVVVQKSSGRVMTIPALTQLEVDEILNLEMA